jgi:hypothetical protein
MALRLARYFGTGTRLWLNLITQDDLEGASQKTGKKVEKSRRALPAVDARSVAFKLVAGGRYTLYLWPCRWCAGRPSHARPPVPKIWSFKSPTGSAKPRCARAGAKPAAGAAGGAYRTPSEAGLGPGWRLPWPRTWAAVAGRCGRAHRVSVSPETRTCIINYKHWQRGRCCAIGQRYARNQFAG